MKDITQNRNANHMEYCTKVIVELSRLGFQLKIDIWKYVIIFLIKANALSYTYNQFDIPKTTYRNLFSLHVNCVPTVLPAGCSDKSLPDGKWLLNLKSIIRKRLSDEIVAIHSNDTHAEVEPGYLAEEVVDMSRDSPILIFSNLHETYHEVMDVASRWNFFGLTLGISPSAIEIIKSNYPHNAEMSLLEVLSLWLKQSYDMEHNLLPTWTTICKAVASKSGGRNLALAKKIAANKYPVDFGILRSLAY